jgi:hypothetical protein
MRQGVNQLVERVVRMRTEVAAEFYPEAWRQGRRLSSCLFHDAHVQEFHLCGVPRNFNRITPRNFNRSPNAITQMSGAYIFY